MRSSRRSTTATSGTASWSTDDPTNATGTERRRRHGHGPHDRAGPPSGQRTFVAAVESGSAANSARQRRGAHDPSPADTDKRQPRPRAQSVRGGIRHCALRRGSVAVSSASVHAGLRECLYGRRRRREVHRVEVPRAGHLGRRSACRATSGAEHQPSCRWNERECDVRLRAARPARSSTR